VRFDVLTIFPSFFDAPFSEGLLGRGRKSGLLDLEVHDLRRWAVDRHRSIDDEAYGGGAGMVFLPEPVIAAVEEVSSLPGQPAPRRLFLSPQGRPLDAELARSLAFEPRLLLLCARYEGVDERVLEAFDWEEISIGDVVVMGGEAPALVLIEAVSRFVPGVVGDPDSVRNDSFQAGLLDYPHYTRPVEVRGMRVPEVLLSGHHERIRRWRLERALAATLRKRPDLLGSAPLDAEARAILEKLRSEERGGGPAGSESSG
jgi:tRNA (guanine37-N1)-methyltransferase